MADLSRGDELSQLFAERNKRSNEVTKVATTLLALTSRADAGPADARTYIRVLCTSCPSRANAALLLLDAVLTRVPAAAPKRALIRSPGSKSQGRLPDPPASAAARTGLSAAECRSPPDTDVLWMPPNVAQLVYLPDHRCGTVDYAPDPLSRIVLTSRFAIQSRVKIRSHAGYRSKTNTSFQRPRPGGRPFESTAQQLW
ncbi:hypothetical protein C8R44DRAFT_891842 [Mycena epipterygia]|nr:hypothetical protein C8R44DRAFT_891842 [Mycena epipterygia]